MTCKKLKLAVIRPNLYGTPVHTGITLAQQVGNFSSKPPAREARRRLQFHLSVKFLVSNESPIKGKENCPKPKKTMMGL